MGAACAAARARLAWELTRTEKGHEVAQKLERDPGAPLPSWYLEEPVADDATRFLVGAFWELTTERQVGMALGHVPASKAREHAERAGLSGGSMTVFMAAIRALDDEYLDWVERRRKRASGKSAGG